jgi:hypothetical protein
MTSADRLRAAAATLITADGGEFAAILADFLDDVAADKDSGLTTIHPRLLDLADLILGDTPEQRPIKVGDPATPLHPEPNCGVRNAQDWECTEPKGHDGPHIACDTERVVAVWP